MSMMILVVLSTHVEMASATPRRRSYLEKGELTENSTDMHFNVFSCYDNKIIFILSILSISGILRIFLTIS